MTRLPLVTYHEMHKIPLLLGFEMRNRTGGHAKFVHRDGRITTPRMHKGELPRGLILTMLSQIGITRREYEDLRGKI